MRILVTSVAGSPDDPRTWSNAPAHMIAALEAEGHECIPLNSTCLTRAGKALLGLENIVRGYPWNAVSWFASARRKRARLLAHTAREKECDFVLCTSTLDAPVGYGVPYGIWLDNTFSLWQRGEFKFPINGESYLEVQRLESVALRGASIVLPFSEHVRESIIKDYNVPVNRVHVVGCGSGSLEPFEGKKDFSKGHLLFVAKHLFAAKGGDLLLEAFPLIRAARPQTKLILVGNEEARDKSKGIEGVDVHGYVDRSVLNRYFHEAAMLVQPMLADPWGQVYLEAMKARAVVVSLNIAALPELTDNGRLGVLIDTPNARALADAVLATYARPQLELDCMTREAQERVIRLYSWEEIGARVCAALRL